VKSDARNCPEASVLDAYASGTLSVERSASVEAHVRTCPDCRANARSVEDSSDFGRMLRDWRSRMTPEERRRTIDSATRMLGGAARREGPSDPSGGPER